MAVCDPCGCKFHTALPCFAEGAGMGGIFFCFFSKPRCRFCHKLYEPSWVCPWHWCKSGKRVDHIGSSEACVTGPVMGIASKFLAAPVLFLALGSAYFRRDMNQAFKGFVNFVLFSAGVGGIMFLGPLVVLIFLVIFLASTLVDWFFPGRCDDCYEYACGGCCSCCCGEIKKPEAAETARYKKMKTAAKLEARKEGAPAMLEMDDNEAGIEGGEEKFQEALVEEQASEGRGGICAMICCLLILAAMGFMCYKMYKLASHAAAQASEHYEAHKNDTATDLADMGAGLFS